MLVSMLLLSQLANQLHWNYILLQVVL